MSDEPTEGALAAMAAERMIVPIEACDGVYAIDPETAALVADRLVAEAVERERARCDTLLNLAQEAWVIIANAYRGNWPSRPDEWTDAAIRWRDAWHAQIDAARIESGETP